MTNEEILKRLNAIQAEIRKEWKEWKAWAKKNKELE